MSTCTIFHTYEDFLDKRPHLDFWTNSLFWIFWQTGLFGFSDKRANLDIWTNVLIWFLNKWPYLDYLTNGLSRVQACAGKCVSGRIVSGLLAGCHLSGIRSGYHRSDASCPRGEKNNKKKFKFEKSDTLLPFHELVQKGSNNQWEMKIYRNRYFLT